MIKRIKNFIARLLPIPAKSSHKMHADLMAALEEKSRTIYSEQQRFFTDVSNQLAEIRGTQKNSSNKLVELEARLLKHTANTESATDKYLKNFAQFKELTKKEFTALIQKGDAVNSTANEILWANVFNNTIESSPWFKNKQVSPGRWAAGYSTMYLLYRVMQSVKPQHPLELGLGESTKIISQYAKANSSVKHQVVEHDPGWIDFWLNSGELPENTEIVKLDWAYQPYKDCEGVRVYDGFAERFSDGKYDFVFVDGPLGGDMKEYSRIDILSIIPNSLNHTFAIIVDDYNRPGEQMTVKEIEEKLKSAEIKYAKRIYDGKKNVCIVCSEDLKFLCTL